MEEIDPLYEFDAPMYFDFNNFDNNDKYDENYFGKYYKLYINILNNNIYIKIIMFHHH